MGVSGKIAQHIPDRTENQIKNRYESYIKKKEVSSDLLLRQGKKLKNTFEYFLPMPINK